MKLLLLWLLAGAPQAVAGQAARPPAARLRPVVLALVDQAQPTHTMLLQRLSRCGVDVLDTLSPATTATQLDASLARLEARAGAALLVFGRQLAGLVPDRPGAPMLVATCDPPPARGRTPVRRRSLVLSLGPDPLFLSSSLRRFLPTLRRVGVLGPAPLWKSPPGARRSLELRVATGEPLATQVLRWKSQVDLLLITDRDQPGSSVEQLVARAREQELPVATTAGWLARSGVAISAAPDAALETLRVRAALQALVGGRQTGARRLPPRLQLDLDAPPWRSRPPNATLLLGADRILGLREGP